MINVLGDELEPCSYDPLTGYYRTGCCENRGDDPGFHVVCVVCTDDFLTFSKNVGNDLSTPMPQHNFPGLKAGDQWCLCASRWQEAFMAGKAPSMASVSDAVLQVLSSSNNTVRTIRFVDAFPTSLSQISLQSTTTDTVYIAATATFRYTHYKFE